MNEQNPNNLIQKGIEINVSGNYTKSFETLISSLDRLNGSLSGMNNRLSRNLDKVEQTGEKSKKAIDKTQESVNKLTSSFNSLGKSLLSPLEALKSISGAAIAPSSFSAILTQVSSLNKNLLSASASWVKYGVGISQVESKLNSIREKMHLTMSDQIALFKEYESGFNFPSLSGFENMMRKLKDATGGDVDEMKRMQGILSNISQQFPDLELSATRLNELDKKRIESLSKIFVSSGKISLSQQKQWMDAIHLNDQITITDKNRKKEITDQIESMNKIKEILEKISQDIYGKLVPYFNLMADKILKIGNEFRSWVSNIALIALSLGTASTLIGGIYQTYKSIKNLSGLGLGGAGLPGGAVGEAGNIGTLGVVGRTIIPAYIGSEIGKRGSVSLGAKEGGGMQDLATVGGGAIGGALWGSRFGPQGALIGLATGMIVGAIDSGADKVSKIIEANKGTEFNNTNIVNQDIKWKTTFEQRQAELSSKIEKYKIDVDDSDKKALDIYNSSEKEKRDLLVKRNQDMLSTKESFVNPETGAVVTYENTKNVDEIEANYSKRIREIESSEEYKRGKELYLSRSEKEQQDEKNELKNALKTDRYSTMMNDLYSKKDININKMSNAANEPYDIHNFLNKLSKETVDKYNLNTGNISSSNIGDIRNAKRAGENLTTEIKELEQNRKDNNLTKEGADALYRKKQDLENIIKLLDTYNAKMDDSKKIAIQEVAYANLRRETMSSILSLQQQQNSYNSAILNNIKVTGDLSGKSIEDYNKGLLKTITLGKDYLNLQKEQLEFQVSNNEAQYKANDESISQNEVQKKSLETEYASLSDDEKNSEKGNSIKAQIDELKEQIVYAKLNQKYKYSEIEANKAVLETLTNGTVQTQIMNQSILESSHVADGVIQRKEVEIRQAKTLSNIMTNMGAGFSSSAGQILKIDKAIEASINASEKNLNNLKEVMGKSIPELADILQSKDKNLSRSDALIKAEDALYAAKTREKEIEQEILDKQNERAQNLKVMRDGYLSAITAMNAGAGTWGKLIVDQNKNTGLAVKNLGILRSMGTGGMGEGQDSKGSRKISQFTTTGFIGASEKEMNRYTMYDKTSWGAEAKKRSEDLAKIAGMDVNNGIKIASKHQEDFNKATAGKTGLAAMNGGATLIRELANLQNNVNQPLSSDKIINTISKSDKNENTVKEKKDQQQIILSGLKISYENLDKLGPMVKKEIDKSMNEAVNDLFRQNGVDTSNGLSQW